MAGTVALVVLAGLWLAWDLLSIRRDLEAGRARLDGLTLDAAASVGLTGLAQDAAAHLDAAADRARGSIPLRALSLVPGVGDQIDGMRSMADATAELGRAGAASATRLDEGLSRAGAPGGRVELLEVALDELGRLERTLEDLDLGEDRGLLPPLRSAHRDLADAVDRARTKLDEARTMVEPVRDVLEGPTQLLLLAANNAEMAGGAGLSLSSGVLTIEDGELDLGEMGPAGDLRLPSAVPIPEELRQIYHPTGLGIDLRSTTRSPDLSATGPIAAEIMARRGVDVDGVVVVDAVALRDLLAVTGPVQVGGQAIDERNVLQEVLHDSYVTFDTLEERYERYSVQAEIAQAVFDAMTSEDLAAIDLVDALLTSSEGRHLVVWSEDPAVQAVWEDLGVAGSLDPHGLLVSVQNYAANKLDWYLHPEGGIDVALLPSGDYRARLEVRVRMPALAELDDASAYILGPSPEKHGVFLTVHLPEAAYDITTPDPGGFQTKGDEAPMQVRSFLVDVPMGTTLERTIDFSLPRDVPALVLLPSARVEPFELTVDGVAVVDDATPTVFGWRAAFPPSPTAEPVSPWVRLPAIGGMAAVVAASALLQRDLRRPPTRDRALVTSLAAGALALFAVAAAIALVLAWSGPQV